MMNEINESFVDNSSIIDIPLNNNNKKVKHRKPNSMNQVINQMVKKLNNHHHHHHRSNQNKESIIDINIDIEDEEQFDYNISHNYDGSEMKNESMIDNNYINNSNNEFKNNEQNIDINNFDLIRTPNVTVNLKCNNEINSNVSMVDMDEIIKNDIDDKNNIHHNDDDDGDDYDNNNQNNGLIVVSQNIDINNDHRQKQQIQNENNINSSTSSSSSISTLKFDKITNTSFDHFENKINTENIKKFFQNSSIKRSENNIETRLNISHTYDDGDDDDDKNKLNNIDNIDCIYTATVNKNLKANIISSSSSSSKKSPLISFDVFEHFENNHLDEQQQLIHTKSSNKITNENLVLNLSEQFLEQSNEIKQEKLIESNDDDDDHCSMIFLTNTMTKSEKLISSIPQNTSSIKSTTSSIEKFKINSTSTDCETTSMNHKKSESLAKQSNNVIDNSFKIMEPKIDSLISDEQQKQPKLLAKNSISENNGTDQLNNYKSYNKAKSDDFNDGNDDKNGEYDQFSDSSLKLFQFPSNRRFNNNNGSTTNRLKKLLNESTKALLKNSNQNSNNNNNRQRNEENLPLLFQSPSSSTSSTITNRNQHHRRRNVQNDNKNNGSSYNNTNHFSNKNPNHLNNSTQHHSLSSSNQTNTKQYNNHCSHCYHHHHHSDYYEPIDNYPTSPFDMNKKNHCSRHSAFESSYETNIDSEHNYVTSAFNLVFPKLKFLKICLLSFMVIYTLISFIFIHERKETWTNVAVQDQLPQYIDLSRSMDVMFPVWKLRARGSFLPKEYSHLTNYSIIFTIVELFDDPTNGNVNNVTMNSKNNKTVKSSSYRVVKRPWAAPIAPVATDQHYIPTKEIEHTFKLTRDDVYDEDNQYKLRIDTNSRDSIGITVTMSGFSELSADGIILAAAVLVFLYILIIFEVVNRTLAAMLGATLAITCLTLIRDRPSLGKVVSWLDVETLSLLFGMMILVAILCETGFFDYVAVVAFRLAKGRTWPLIYTLCMFTGIMSAFLDNVTTILLMTPVTIRLCEIKNIEPKHVLISLVIISNIGGAATPVGDPPNVIIISSTSIQQQGINFGRFTLHMMPGIIISFIATLIYIRIYYRNLSNVEYQDNNTSSGDDTEDNLIEFKNMNEQQRRQRRLQQQQQLNSMEQTILVPPQPPTTSKSTATSSLIENYFLNGHNNNKSYQNLNDKHQHKQETIFNGDESDDDDGHNENDNFDSTKMPPIKRCPNCTNLAGLCSDSFKDDLCEDRRVFRSSDELKREIEVWKRACNSIVGYSRDENSVRTTLNQKVETLETILQQHCYETVPPEDNYRSVLAELEQKYKIRDWPLLIKSVIVMSLVISLFFMQSIPNLDLSLGWIAILGAILLLVLSDRHELESIMGRVEWSTLIFFAALFVVMEALAELKFLWWIGQLTQDFINSVPEQSRLIVAILVFIWISALSSSFIDNIPLTTVMVKIIEDLAENNEFNIPLVPLIYALAFGACLGGNGTLIGASSNVVCSGVAEQHGYRFTFLDFFKIGFPIMLLTVSISTIYLIICHVLFEWNY